MKGCCSVGFVAASDQSAQTQDHLRIFQILVVDADRFQAVFQGRVEAGQRKLPGRGIIGQGGDGEDVVPGKFVDEMGNAGDIIRPRASLLTCNRVQDIGR